MFVKKKGKCLDIKIMTQSHKTIVESIQGLSQRRSENNGLLLPKYESEGLPDPTGGSTDVVHLLI